MGYMFGVALPGLFNRLRLEYWGLYPVFSMAWVLLLYVLAGKIGGNGFLAVYIAGMFINKKEFAQTSIRRSCVCTGMVFHTEPVSSAVQPMESWGDYIKADALYGLGRDAEAKHLISEAIDR